MKFIITEQQNNIIKCLLDEEIKFKRHLFLEFYNRVPFLKENYLSEIHGYFQDEDNNDDIIKIVLGENINQDNLFKTFNYLINLIERNAFIGQIKTELEDYQLEMEDGNTAWKIFKKTRAYSKYLYLENFVRQLNLISSEELQDKYIEDYNISNGTFIKTFDKLLKVVNNKWNKYKKKYINTACKIIYDIFYENKTMIR